MILFRTDMSLFNKEKAIVVEEHLYGVYLFKLRFHFLDQVSIDEKAKTLVESKKLVDYAIVKARLTIEENLWTAVGA